MEDKDYLQIAIGKAEQSLDEGGFPAGAILVLNDMVI
jgi:tRNA(Arg) A34 adenosine deaminase TadA